MWPHLDSSTNQSIKVSRLNRVINHSTYNGSAVTGNGLVVLMQGIILVTLILELNGSQFMFR